MPTTLANGTLIFTDDDFCREVEATLGYEARVYIEELVERGDKAKYLAESDFRAYEMQVEEQTSALIEIGELANQLTVAKPAARKKLIERICSIVSEHV